jgi:hypothetical protein
MCAGMNGLKARRRYSTEEGVKRRERYTIELPLISR